MQSFVKRQLLCSVCMIGLFFGQSAVASAEVAIIVHPSNSATIEKADIERMFMGKIKSFSSGSEVIPANAGPAAPSRAEFEDKVIGRTSAQINAYWAKIVFTGKGSKPKELDSDAAILSFVASTPGAIAYVDAGAVNDSVKVVAKF